MRMRTLTFLWPSFLMAGVLDGIVFSLIDPADGQLIPLASGVSPQGIYTLGFFVFWCVIACASGMTALLLVECEDRPAP
jgi:hypothetical protein